MNLTEPTRNRSIPFVLVALLVLMSLAGGSEQAQASQRNSDELLLEIMDLHSELVTNETFLAQAKMLGVYLKAAQSLEESKKIKIYSKVLDILVKIKESAVQISPRLSEIEGEAEKKTLEEDQERKSVYEPGAALLEIFKADKAESLDNLPDLPVIRTYWNRDLACSSHFVLPDRISEIGRNSPYVAKFSFYYEAKRAGKYGFTVQHVRVNNCKLRIGGVDVVEANPTEPAAQGVCNLQNGFHRVEFWLISRAKESGWSPGREKAAGFQVKILTPDAFDAVPFTKDMMLLKKEE